MLYAEHTTHTYADIIENMQHKLKDQSQRCAYINLTTLPTKFYTLNIVFCR